MKIPHPAPLLCTVALCMLSASAAPDVEIKPLPPLEQAREAAAGVKSAMESMISAIEKITDEKSAKLAADAILASTANLQKFLEQGREWKDKLTEEDKKELEKTMGELDMTQFKDRFAAAFMALADKPELIAILQPAISSFRTTAMNMAGDTSANKEQPIRARDKGMLPRGPGNRGNLVPNRDRGNEVPNAKPKATVE